MTHPIYLPFSSVFNSWQYTTIYDGKKDVVCRLDLEDWHVTEDNQGALEEDQSALASFIVSAVNSHNTLTLALLKIADLVDSDAGEPLDDAIKIARDALALSGRTVVKND